VREFTAEDEKRVIIVLDTNAKGPDGDYSQRFEGAVVHAASLLKHFIDERAEVRLILGTEVGSYGSGPEHLYDNLRRLALVVNQDFFDADSAGGQLQGNVSAEEFAIVLTSAPPGSIPARVWRSSHVIYF
jgi:uncharacterized protein (DUF58 family)